MDKIDITEDDPSSTANESDHVICIRADRPLTEEDHRQIWLAHQEIRLYMAARNAHRLRRVVDGG